ncbi:iron ABC transporter permease [Telmatospirillum sp. J64-1]|uniref:ABC transporter permease n=1 Tax=Telmatospirillum sp. J64-1 TaxID=2502183 RepID=UPI00115D2297|nr:iron ABC transporter permease [Telmatospirillum sp. J64-1]
MERQGGGLILGLSLSALALVVALPMLFVFLQALFPYLTEGSFRDPFGSITRTLSEPRLPGLLGNTILLGISVALCSLVIALPLAVLRGLTKLPAAPLWDLLLLIPFMVPPYVGAFSWILTLQPGGFSTQLLGIDGGSLIFSFTGIVLVMSLHLFPVVYFALSRTMATVGGRFASVARVCGASPLRAFLTVTLPLSTPGLAASLLLVFALSIEEFGTPATLGAHAGFHVLVTAIHLRFTDWPIDLPGAAVLSMLLVVLALGAFLLQHWIITRRTYVSVAGKSARDEAAPLGPWRLPAVALFSAVSLVAVVIPVGAVILSALSRTLSGGLSPDNLGLENFAAIFANRGGALDALRTSLSLAVGAALCAGLLGTLTAFITVRSTLPGRRMMDFLSLLPNALPGMVVAVGLILAWNREWWPVPIYNSMAILLLAYVCLLLPYPVRYVGAGLRQIGESLDAAARVSGAGFGMTLRRILVPLIAPNLMVSMLLVFAIASRELVSSIMLAPPGVSTVATFVFGQFEQGSPGLGMAMSVIAIFSSTALLVALNQMQRRVSVSAD